MNAKILNKDFQHPPDGWYQIEARGEHPNRAAGVVQVIDAESVVSIVNRFNADAAAGALRHGNEMLIDHEHFSDQADQESRAYGWLQELQNRADGIYGRIRWTATGKAAVDGGDYRFFSTEYEPQSLKVLNAGKTPARVRPLQLDGLSLTNMNNNRGQKPITNRDPNQPRQGAPASTADNQPNKKQTMKSVCTLLGLSADADEASVHAAVTKLMNRGDIAAPELVTLRKEHGEFKTQNETLLGEQVDGLLDLHQVKDEKLRNRLKPVLISLKNREDRVAALLDFGHKPLDPKTAKGGQQQRLLNREDGKTVDASTESGAVTITGLHAEVRKIMNRDGSKFEAAYGTLMTEKPELFAKPETK